MFRFIDMVKKADSKTRWFYFQLVIYMVTIVVTTVYVYARLNFDRSGLQPTKQTEMKQ